MNFTEEMLAEDEKRWHARDVVTELGYCGNYMRDRKDMTNLDIRFYAYIMRKAHEMLKAQRPRVMTLEEVRTAEVVWLEQVGECVCAIKIQNFDNGTMSFAYAYNNYTSFINIKPEHYGKVSRCWTSRPTDERREATPW